MKIVIGNRNYSTWSLRGWLALKQTGADFEEVVIPLDTPETHAAILSHSAAGRVPVLIDGDVTVWDSLAIIEYLAELFPQAGLWPQEQAARAHARAIVAEMHSGFAALRGHYPMNIRRTPAARPEDAAVEADVARVMAIWNETRARFGQGGDFLYGAFSAADAFYAPVVSRFVTYEVAVDAAARAYMEAVMAHPAMAEWCAAGLAETWIVPADEVD
ncbi:glutathione S-transferase [Breoghania corrubedonensis]|uniref:Glutathione S-transferase n=1 Tax=Breoghania corrubedonensis TaxID=665038 RepID=A0A2T5VCM0_9HYPH|nr:glutathione S-transferase family protein [Breoghania corrubedonensis]PTW61500.1 glutathione S-transferase [Breoghania corrubedonensis]